MAVGYASVVDGLLSVLVAKYTARGQLDRSFSGDGFRVIERAVEIVAVDVLVQSDGKFLVLLYGEHQDNGVLRLKADGRTDRTYGGGDGIADLPGDWQIRGLARDGTRVVVVADEFGAIHVVRLKQNGARSTSFGAGTVGPTWTTRTSARRMRQTSRCRMTRPSSSPRRTATSWSSVSRPSGQQDTSFNGGLGFVEVGGDNQDSMTNVRVDGRGRIVAAGRLGLGNPDIDPVDQVVYRFLSG